MTQQNSSNKTESKYFNLVIDEDRAEIIQIMMTVFSDEYPQFVRQERETAERLYPALINMAEEWSEKVHEIGWCKDPDCEQK